MRGRRKTRQRGGPRPRGQRTTRPAKRYTSQSPTGEQPGRKACSKGRGQRPGSNGRGGRDDGQMAGRLAGIRGGGGGGGGGVCVSLG